jgi:Protein kinase domain/zinc-ribbon domain
MFCSRCGTKLADNTKLCTNCGLDLAPTTPVKAIASGEVTERDIVADALSADFEILEELGRGGMAIVYRARDLHLEREVAIKVLPFSLAFDAEFVERFQREARTAAALEHPNVIPIYRVGKAGRVTYFVMKLLRGRSLSHLLHTRGRLTPPEIRRLLIEAGSGIGYAAKRGIVHRDIKPDNIMFDEHGVCMVADFGIAKAATGQRLTGTGMSIGTPHYMSPEQARAQNTDGRSDMYSLGVVAYQCLTGKVPYDGEDSFAIGYKHIMEPIPIPDLDTADERRLFEVIRRMIQKLPGDRYETCDELIAALEGQPVSGAGTLRGSGMGASPVAFPNQPTTPMPRAETQPGIKRPVATRAKSGNPAVLWGMLVLLAAAAAAAGYYFIGVRSSGSAVAFDSIIPEDSAQQAAALANAQQNDSTAGGPASQTASGQTAGGQDGRTADSAPPATIPSPPPQAAQLDSGGIRLSGLPRGTRVMVDEQPVTSTTIRLAPGTHVLAISAPRFQFFADTFQVEPGVVLDMAPNLVPLGGTATRRRQTGAATTPAAATCDEPGPGYNADRSCFDQRPRPVNPPFVPLTAEVEGTPRSSVLLVQVSADGKSLQVRPFNPSNDAAFERLAREYATTMEWRPATKDGTAVTAWTQMAFPPRVSE